VNFEETLRICEKISWTISAEDFLSATRRRTHTGCHLARTTKKLRAKNPAIMFRAPIFKGEIHESK